jgi:hypothetical protein
LPAHLYLGDTGNVEEGALEVIAIPTLPAAVHAESVGLWVLSELYAGRPERSVEILSEHHDVLTRSPVSGFVTFSRAEVAMACEPAERLGLLERSAGEAAAARSSFHQRLVEIARLAVLVDDAQLDDAREAALGLVPRILGAATAPQAWTAMRHVARLLAQLDQPAVALRILDAADLADAAPGVVGDDLAVLTAVRRSCESAVAEPGHLGRPVPLGQLWDEVAAVLTPD